MRRGVCCHEASDACEAIEDAIGMEHGGEPSAYLIGWIASCINNDGSRLEDTCFYSNRNSLLDKKIQQVHILQAKSTEFGQGTRINQISLLRS